MRDFQCAKVQEEGLIEDVWDGNSGAMILSPYWYALGYSPSTNCVVFSQLFLLWHAPQDPDFLPV
jgi:hypothetical protein